MLSVTINSSHALLDAFEIFCCYTRPALWQLFVSYIPYVTAFLCVIPLSIASRSKSVVGYVCPPAVLFRVEKAL